MYFLTKIFSNTLDPFKTKVHSIQDQKIMLKYVIPIIKQMCVGNELQVGAVGAKVRQSLIQIRYHHIDCLKVLPAMVQYWPQLPKHDR